MDDIQQIIAYCEDLYTPIMLELDYQWLTSLNLDKAFQQRDFFVARVHSKIEGNQAFFEALHETGGFPYWFGFDQRKRFHDSWYAEWQPASGYVIIFEQPISLDSRSHLYFLKSIEHNMRLWAHHDDIPFKVVTPRLDTQSASYNAPQSVQYTGFIQQILAHCEDLYAPVVLELAHQWLISPNLHEALAQQGYVVARVQTEIEGDKAFFDALYEACRFPDWFGFNWDALNDSLGDFHWHPAFGYIIIFEHVPMLDSRGQGFLRDILEGKQEQWARLFGIPFKVFVPQSEAVATHQNGHLPIS